MARVDWARDYKIIHLVLSSHERRSIVSGKVKACASILLQGMGVQCFNLHVAPSPACPSSGCFTPHVLQTRLGPAGWLSASLYGGSLRHRAHGITWTPSGDQDRTRQEAPLAYQSQDEAPSTTSAVTATAPPAELFQNALSALDLFSPSSSRIADTYDPPEEISVDHGQTAASVGRAIYEVRRSCKDNLSNRTICAILNKNS